MPVPRAPPRDPVSPTGETTACTWETTAREPRPRLHHEVCPRQNRQRTRL